MIIPILRTKLFIPTLRPSLVSRRRLLDLLDAAQSQKLTLISAPAGFGKTTLITSWIAQTDLPVAWLSLDEADSNSTVFLTYLIAAIQTLSDRFGPATNLDSLIGQQALELLNSAQSAPVTSVLTALLNDIASIAQRFVLVLDDYHLLDAPEIDEALSFLINHLPPQMHLAITTREDPNLPLARLRVRNQLTEVRAADLRFTNDEAQAFLRDVMGVTLSPSEISALESRTEGWIAGLQMAALSMQSGADQSRFVQAFTGSNRFVLDYLLEEVLQQQSDAVRAFLLQTSILDRLSGPLCAQVTGNQESATMLESLERGNLFVIPIDDQRQWFRYHHLFAEMLQARLVAEQHDAVDGQDLVAGLHKRASSWYETNELMQQAIHHSLAAQDFERVANLVERVWRIFDRGNQHQLVYAWLKAMPDEMIQARPMLSTALGWILMNLSQFDAAEGHLDRAERLHQEVDADAADDEMVPIFIAGARAYLAQARGDFPGSIEHAQRVLELLPDDNDVERAVPASLLGLASWAEGDLETAYAAFSDVQKGFKRFGKEIDANEIGHVLADIRRAQGRLQLALQQHQETLNLAQSMVESGKPPPRGMANFYVGLGEIYAEMGDLAVAQEALNKSESLGKTIGLEDWPHRIRMAKARLQAIHGEFDSALQLLEEAEQVYYRSPLPNVRPISALKARIWIRQGRLAEAQQWANHSGLSASDELNYLREFEHITLARLLMAQAKGEKNSPLLNKATQLLQRLQQYAEIGKRIGRVIEIETLIAIAQETAGDRTAALTTLEGAVAHAEPEGYVYLFVDEGPTMSHLLALTAEQSPYPDYIHQLLGAFAEEEPQSKGITQQPDLVEQLSERELEILRLIAVGKKNQEIADELIISLNTVRYHTKNIYGKLGVNKRTQAVARSQALGLL